ncbi:MAG: AtpZ/AtpI family protein [Pirellulales bacterium]
MALAFEWAITITTISATMVLPGLLGYWLDQRLGTRVVFMLLGFAIGGVLAASALLRIAQNRPKPGGKQDGGQDHVGQSNNERLG